MAFGTAVGGGAAGISGFVNIGVLTGIASPPVLVVTGVIAAANVITSGVGVWKCWKSKDQLNKLRTEIEEVEGLRCDAVKMKVDLEEKTDMILNAIMELTGSEFDDSA